MSITPTYPYGPNTPQVRQFLITLAAMGRSQRHEVRALFDSLSQQNKWHRAELELARVMAESGREELRETVAGPFLALVRENSAQLSPEDEPVLDEIAEPALAMLLATLVRDIIANEHFNVLAAPFNSVNESVK